MEQKSNSTLYPQLTNLYSVDYWDSHVPVNQDESLYITPEGNIFALKYRGFLSHENFSKLFYANYAEVKETFKDKENLTSNLEDVIGESVDLKDIYDYYYHIISPLDYINHDKFSEARREIEEDMLLVQDMGFIKVVARPGDFPWIGVPMPMFGRRTTQDQLETVEFVLEKLQRSFTYHNKERDVEMYIKDMVRKTNRFSNDVEELLEKSKNQ